MHDKQNDRSIQNARHQHTQKKHTCNLLIDYPINKLNFFNKRQIVFSHLIPLKTIKYTDTVVIMISNANMSKDENIMLKS